VEAEKIISIRNVTMRFPIAKRLRELALHPFRAKKLSTALTDISIDIQRGDRIAVLGPNGAGKTTLLRLTGGLLIPSKGEVVVNGFNTQHENNRARKSVGFVLNEERSFFWRLDATQNLEFFGALDNLQGPELNKRIRELIHLVGLEEAANTPISFYSSGMKQRLALARGLIADPEVLILDEPTRTLDPIACEDFIELIMDRIHHDFGKTLLIATHRLEEAIKLCNKALIINKGRNMAFDSLSNITDQGINLADYYRSKVLPGTASNHRFVSRHSGFSRLPGSVAKA
jgi:ABC-2 type transport system ATP-binding protein